MNKIVGDIVLFMDIMNLILCQWRHLLAKKQFFGFLTTAVSDLILALHLPQDQKQKLVFLFQTLVIDNR